MNIVPAIARENFVSERIARRADDQRDDDLGTITAVIAAVTVFAFVVRIFPGRRSRSRSQRRKKSYNTSNPPSRAKAEGVTMVFDIERGFGNWANVK